VKGIPLLKPRRSARNLLLLLVSIFALVSGVRAQETSAAPQSAPAPPAEADALPRRIARARALAAVGKLGSAATELESLRASSTDESVREVTRILLMWIYVEMPDYARAAAMLEETFKERAASPNEASTRAFYATAGQTVNGVRAHLDRYRTFGLDIAGADLPADAYGDLEQLRALLERVVEYSKTIREDEARTAGAKGLESTALLEDAASVRLRIARHTDDRTRWQSEVSDARQRLFASETRIASISAIPASRPDIPAPSPNGAPSTVSPNKSGEQKAPARSRNSKSDSSKKPEAPAAAATTTTTRPPSSAPAQTGAQPSGATNGGSGAKAEAGAPIAVGALVSKAKQKVSPSYPPIARTARITGLVTVYIVVNEKGEVESVQRADGPAQLQQAAMEAAKRWKFFPTVVDGQPVRVTGFLSFNFLPST
jgi:protein TonB